MTNKDFFEEILAGLVIITLVLSLIFMVTISAAIDPAIGG